MTTYKLRNIDMLLKTKRETTERIIYILSLEKKGKGLTTTQIYKKGKERFGEDFPKNKTTVLRYLNTMYEYGIVDKKKWYWYLTGDSQIKTGEVVAKFDIENIRESLKYKNQFHDTLFHNEITIYGICPFIEKFYRNRFNEILENLKRIYEEFVKLNNFAIIKKLHSKYEKNYSAYSSLCIGKKTIENLKFNRNVINIIRLIVVVFVIRQLQEILLHSKKQDIIKNLKEIEIKLENIYFDISQVDIFRGDLSTVSDKLYLLFSSLRINKNGKPLFIEESGSVVIHPSQWVPLAKIIKKCFYKKRAQGDIVDDLKKTRFKDNLIEMINKDITDMKDYIFLYIYHDSPSFPIVVINPMKEKSRSLQSYTKLIEKIIP